MKFFDLYAGIGGFRLGLEALGHECVGWSEKDKFAIDSYKAIHDTEGEWFEKDAREIDPREMPNFDILCAGFPCFPAGTEITTKDGRIPIEDISVGDKVLTHKSRYREVVETMDREYNDSLIKIKAPYNIEVDMTKEHPVLVRDRKKVWNNESIIYESVYSEPYWKNAENVEAGQYLSVPIPKESERELNKFFYEFGINGSSSELREIDLENEDFWWCVGHYLAEGWYEKRRKRNGKWTKSQKSIVAVNKDETEYVYKKYNKVFDSVTVSKEQTVNKLHIVNIGFHSFVSRLGDNATEKRLPSGFTKLPDEYLNSMLDGYVYGDGCILDDGTISISTVSEHLAKDVKFAFTVRYKTMAGIGLYETKDTTTIGGRTVKQQDIWQVRIKPNRQKEVYNFYEDNSIWVKVKEVSKIEQEKIKVYNIGVREDESYVASWISVHNCQSFSVAGNRKGFADTRGTLFFEIARISRQKLPSLLFLENVKGLLNHANGQTFLKILETLDGLGYDAEWQMLNSKDFGVPQNRERVFIIGHLRGAGTRKVFPIKRKNAGTLREHTTGMSQGYRVYDTEGISCTLAGEAGGMGAKTGLYLEGLNTTEEGNSFCIDSNYHKGISPNQINSGRRTQVRHDMRIRKLTPKECWRLQGFSDEAFERAVEVNSDTQLYRQAGNAVTVNVVRAIAENFGRR